MTRHFIALLTTILLTGAFPAAADDTPVPPKRAIYDYGVDFAGTDLANIFDTTLNACEAACLNTASCEAFTFNQRSNACFPKRDITGSSPYDGAISGTVIVTSSRVLAGVDARMTELSFLTPPDFAEAAEVIDSQTWRRDNISGQQGRAAAIALRSDQPQDWLFLAQLAAAEGSNISQFAVPASIAAYLRATDSETQRAAAVDMATYLEQRGRGRTMIDALRLAQSLRFDPQTALALTDAIGKYGFRVVDTQIDSDSATPRICAIFSENLIGAGTDYAPYVQLSDPKFAVSVSDGQLCIDGVAHGERYRVVLRDGLPAASGEKLIRAHELWFYVRDRSPSAAFVGRAYVLPRLGDIAIPLETVNLSELALNLRRVDDRNILRAAQDGLLGAMISQYEDDRLSSDIGSDVWSGTAEVPNELNRDVLTRIPLGDALTGAPAGVYVLTATATTIDNDTPAATQWFVLSDLGVATYLGNDGLTVAVRSLANASASAGASVALISNSNTVLARTETDADGVVNFDAGLTRGTGGNAPALVTVTMGDDMTYMSLTEAAFDLSDRGVAGREPSPPMDVFLATDRGAYRAGETIHMTALMRDATTKALPGVPLTAILTRPDGVEYSRITATDDVAGGHVFALPVATTAPRGTWRISVFADLDAPSLARQTVLVEDFLPERIDFDMSLPDRIALGDIPMLRVDARYLFGAVGADLGIEGEALLTAARSLDGYPNYRFGTYDARFEPQLRYLESGTTDADGVATLAVALPDLRASQPLELRVTARVTEGSGRPVERQITTPVLPDQPMIGIKPDFDGVISEFSKASFDLIALNPDLTSADMPVQWAVNKVTTRYRWYSLNGYWDWEPVTTRERIASGTATLGDGPIRINADVSWGQHEVVVEATGAQYISASTDFYAGWYAPASTNDTPDLLEASLNADSYAIGDTATFRIVPRYDGVAVITVMSDRVIHMQAVPVTTGENLITLPVTQEWGAGAYVSASVIRPMDVQAGHNPARALGLGYAQVAPGDKALAVTLSAPDMMEPRGPLVVDLQVDGIAPGETAYVTLAAVDLGILNLTRFDAPDPQDHYFGQRKLGVELRDVYGRLIDGLNGAIGTVRSGGDAMAQTGMQSPPPTEDLVTFFTGPITMDATGHAQVSFDVPAFDGTIRLMAVAWSDRGVGQASHDVVVRGPVVVTASVPRFMAPGDQSRMLLEIQHADGPSGTVGIKVVADGLALAGALPPTFALDQGGKQVFEVPFGAFDPGDHTLRVLLTLPDGREVVKTFRVPVVVNDPEISRTSRFDLAAGATFTFDDDIFAGLVSGTGHATLTVGPLAQFDVPGLISLLDRYPYGCTEQITSRAMPLLYLNDVAAGMGLAETSKIADRINTAIAEVTANQAANGGFGLWRPSSGDLWLDAYVTDFLSRARAAGYAVPNIAFDNAIDNLRNAVNYYPDFANGGDDLAYALYVLAREGQAAVGDLRYYADEKPEAFNTPLAYAQLGAALAQYGDQRRADSLFSNASGWLVREIGADERRNWRSDYGTNRRDIAAVLTLAAEAGSNTVDRERLVPAVSARQGYTSTQEAAWTLLAANALIRDSGNGSVTVNGDLPAGPLVQMRSADTGAAPVIIANSGRAATDITITTFGVPAQPEPAGGRGYAINRAYYTMDGAATSLAGLVTGTRLVTVLTVQPFGPQEARLMVNDPLPAGLEIDNPNLIQGGDIEALDWLDLTSPENAQFLNDRFLAAVDWRSEDPFQLAYIVRAVSPGTFHHPAASVEDMYRPDMRARTDTGQVSILP